MEFFFQEGFFFVYFLFFKNILYIFALTMFNCHSRNKNLFKLR